MKRSLIKCVLGKIYAPLNNRKAALEQGNTGISLTVSIVYTLIGLTIMLGLFALFLNNAKEMQNKEKELRQKENDSISFDDEEIPSMSCYLSDNSVINFNC